MLTIMLDQLDQHKSYNYTISYCFFYIFFIQTVTRAFGFHMIKSISIKFRQLDSVVVTVAPLGLIGWGFKS